ncbi:MAG: IS607 family transposase [Caldisericaceae bacterium]
MKLNEWAKKQGISYKTAWRLFKSGKIDAYQLPTGTIIVKSDNPELSIDNNTVAIYARVSSLENKDNLERQAERLKEYSLARGWKIIRIVKEIGSGVNDTRAKLIELLRKKDYKILVIEHKDRLTRFGFNYLKLLCETQGKIIEVVNGAEEEKEDIVKDFVAIIYSFAAKLYGLRRAHKKTEKIIAQIQNEEDS